MSHNSSVLSTSSLASIWSHFAKHEETSPLRALASTTVKRGTLQGVLSSTRSSLSLSFDNSSQSPKPCTTPSLVPPLFEAPQGSHRDAATEEEGCNGEREGQERKREDSGEIDDDFLRRARERKEGKRRAISREGSYGLGNDGAARAGRFTFVDSQDLSFQAQSFSYQSTSKEHGAQEEEEEEESAAAAATPPEDQEAQPFEHGFFSNAFTSPIPPLNPNCRYLFDDQPVEGMYGEMIVQEEKSEGDDQASSSSSDIIFMESGMVEEESQKNKKRTRSNSLGEGPSRKMAKVNESRSSSPDLVVVSNTIDGKSIDGLHYRDGAFLLPAHVLRIIDLVRARVGWLPSSAAGDLLQEDLRWERSGISSHKLANKIISRIDKTVKKY